MTTFVLLPGAGGAAWYWHRVVPQLEDAGIAPVSAKNTTLLSGCSRA